MKLIKKAVILAVLAAFTSVSLLSCTSSVVEVSDESGISRYTDTDPDTDSVEDDDESLVYPAVYVNTNSYGDDSTVYPRIVTISTREELEKYTSDNETLYDFATNSYSASFYDTATKYDATFFETNSLVMAIVWEESVSYTHGNLGFSKNGDSYDMNLIRFVKSQQVDAEAVWHVIFEIPKTSPVLDGEIKLNIIEESI